MSTGAGCVDHVDVPPEVLSAYRRVLNSAAQGPAGAMSHGSATAAV